MKVQSISMYSPHFGQNIIDVHAHSGVQTSHWNSKPFASENLDEFIKSPLYVNVNGVTQNDKIKKVIVSDIDGLTWSHKQQTEVEQSGRSKYDLKPEEIIFEKDEISANLDMVEKHKNNSVYQVLGVCQPSKTGGEADNIRELIADNPRTFVGLKFHPQSLMLRADSELYDDYLNLASKKKLPVLFHSQVSIDYDLHRPNEILNWSDPEYIYNLAKRHPDVPVILGHTGAGGRIAHKKAINILMKSIENNDAKLYAEISWMDFVNGEESIRPDSIIELITKLQKYNRLDRIMFGSDAPLGCYGERLITQSDGSIIPAKKSYENTIGRIKSAIKNNFGEDANDIINKIFYENADELFFKKKWAKKSKQQPIIEENIKKAIKIKPVYYVLGTLAIISSLLYILGVKKSHK